MTDLIALLFGGVIIVFFAYERFNRTTDEAGKQLQRLVTLLTPDKLRSRRVVLNAYGFYAATLLLIYFFLCAYAELLPALGGPDLGLGADKLPTPPGEAEASQIAGFSPAASASLLSWFWNQSLSSSAGSGTDGSTGISVDSSTSLAVALLIVGLAPSFPILQQFEIWMRGAAHSLAGIPTRVLTIRDELRAQPLDLGAAAPSLIPQDDRERMSWYRTRLKEVLESPDDFLADLDIVFAVSAWMLDRRLRLPGSQARDRFLDLEKVLKERKDTLIERLDARTAYSFRRTAKPAPKTTERPTAGNAQPNDPIGPLTDELTNLAEDMCLLLALYAEHGIIVSGKASREAEDDDRAVGVADANSAAKNALAQRNARKLLESYLGDYLHGPQGPARSRSYSMTTALWVFFVVLLLAAVWSQFPGVYEMHLQAGQPVDAYWRFLEYATSALMAYFVPVALALAVRNAWRQFQLWENLRTANWTSYVPQAGFVLVLSWLLATSFLLGSALWQSAIAVGWDTILANPWQTLRRIFAYNAPTPVRGAVLAVIVIVVLDTWRQRTKTAMGKITLINSFYWGLAAAALLGVAGGLTRWATSWAGALQAAVPRDALQAADRGLIAYAAMFSALVGFCVIFSISEVQRNQRRPSR